MRTIVVAVVILSGCFMQEVSGTFLRKATPNGEEKDKNMADEIARLKKRQDEVKSHFAELEVTLENEHKKEKEDKTEELDKAAEEGKLWAQSGEASEAAEAAKAAKAAKAAEAAEAAEAADNAQAAEVTSAEAAEGVDAAEAAETAEEAKSAEAFKVPEGAGTSTVAKEGKVSERAKASKSAEEAQAANEAMFAEDLPKTAEDDWADLGRGGQTWAKIAKTAEVAEAQKSRKSFCDAADGFAPEFSDEFDDDRLNTDVWQVINSDGRAEGDHTAVVAGLDTTACRTARCRNENVFVRDGKLHLLSERISKGNVTNLFTGAVTTKGKRTWADSPGAYRMCISAKLPGSAGESGKGIWPAHWMLPDNGISDSCLDEGEMDIMEMVNSDGGSWSTFHWMSSYPKKKCADFKSYHKSMHSKTQMPSDWNTDFHEYALERSPEHIAFAVDGRVVLNVSAEDTGQELSHTPFFLILNTAIGGAWPGEPSALTQLPAEHLIDYVRVARQKEGALLQSKVISEAKVVPSWNRKPGSSVTWASGDGDAGPPPLSYVR